MAMPPVDEIEAQRMAKTAAKWKTVVADRQETLKVTRKLIGPSSVADEMNDVRVQGQE